MSDRYYPSDVHRFLQEINELISLAEDISRNIEKNREIIFRNNMIASVSLLLISMLGLIISFLAPIPEANRLKVVFLTGAIFGVLGFMIFAYSARKMRNIQRAVSVDRRLLGDLLDAISTHLSLIEGRIGAVEFMLLKMRARRLSLSPNDGALFFRQSSED